MTEYQKYHHCQHMRGVLRTQHPLSAWGKGVKEYAYELMASYEDWLKYHEDAPRDRFEFKEAILNGAQDFKEYSYGGCSLIYDADIAKRLCTKTELRRTDNGMKEPNSQENWLDVQTRALTHAFQMLEEIRKFVEGEDI